MAKQKKVKAPKYSEKVDNSDITLKSLSKSNRYLGFGVVLLLVGIFSLAGFFFYTQTIQQNEKIACWTVEKEVENMASQYVKVNGLTSYPTYLEDIPTFSETLGKKTCPSGGTFTWNPVTGEYTCSIHGHHPEGFMKPKSQTIQSITNEELQKQAPPPKQTQGQNKSGLQQLPQKNQQQQQSGQQ